MQQWPQVCSCQEVVRSAGKEFVQVLSNNEEFWQLAFFCSQNLVFIAQGALQSLDLFTTAQQILCFGCSAIFFLEMLCMI